MDKTRVCGTLATGSTPVEGTKKKRPARSRSFIFIQTLNLDLFNLLDLSRQS